MLNPANVDTGPGKEGRDGPGRNVDMSGDEPKIRKHIASCVSREFARRTLRPFKLVKYIID